VNKPAPPPSSSPNPLKRPALGRGLEALLPGGGAARPAAAPAEGQVLKLRLEQIQPNPHQPRRRFEPEALAELAASLRQHGVLQPLLVRAYGSGYEIVAGERRFRAAQLAGLETVPALLQSYNDQRSLEVALVENLQRADLNPVEEARAYQQLSQQFRLTQEQIAERTGKDRATIANSLRLLRLDQEVLDRLESGPLRPGQLRPLIGLEPALQRSLAAQIEAQGWTARKVEETVARLQQPPAPPKPPIPRDPNERAAEEHLARSLGAKVSIKAGKRQRGVIEIAYNGLDEFQRLYERLAPEN